MFSILFNGNIWEKQWFHIRLVILSLFGVKVCIADTSQLSVSETGKLTPIQQLGKQIFFDTNLSSPAGQSCASCHDPKTAFTDPVLNSPVSIGVIPEQTGTRNSPTATYASYSPFFQFDDKEGLHIGGQFWDGRAATLSEQAKGPFLNPAEMNNNDKAEVVSKLQTAPYVDLFKQVYGVNALDNVDQAYQSMADAIAAFENTSIFNRFSSKYDYFLAGRVKLSNQELKGLQLYNDVNKGNCAACHPSTTIDNSPPLFTDFTYDNLGVPKNPVILAKKGQDFVDFGLGAIINDVNEKGKFKVPTLRNIDKTAPYFHNGIFKTLREVVNFYNTRDTDSKWGKPEVAENVNIGGLGNLKLTAKEVDNIVAFLKTLSDGYNPDATGYYDNRTGLITLPQVRIEDVSTKFNMERFVLKVISDASPKQYRLIERKPIDSSESSDIGSTDITSIPSFSSDNGILEVPLLIVDSRKEYIAQLKRIDNKKNIFKLVYLKQLS
jgi:cytochrome c peroxidase